jgi:hypothetical protein
VADRDAAGQRKVRLMTIWVGIGSVLMVVGIYSSMWITFLGACVIGSTPVFFTLRGALASRRTPKPSSDAQRGPGRAPARRPRPRRSVTPRRRGDDW